MKEWKIIDNKLYKLFKFKDFLSAFKFMTDVALEAENQKHHPDWSNNYNVVEIFLTTHDSNNQITEKDYLLAQAIDLIYQKSIH
jgi:4a-hydroxytetrahydrobiopterin dehydratase